MKRIVLSIGVLFTAAISCLSQITYVCGHKVTPSTFPANTYYEFYIVKVPTPLVRNPPTTFLSITDEGKVDIYHRQKFVFEKAPNTMPGDTVRPMYYIKREDGKYLTYVSDQQVLYRARAVDDTGRRGYQRWLLARKGDQDYVLFVPFNPFCPVLQLKVVNGLFVLGFQHGGSITNLQPMVMHIRPSPAH